MLTAALATLRTMLYNTVSQSYIGQNTGRLAIMSDDNFSDYIARERERLSREREEISNQRRELDNRLAAIDREFQAIEAYQTAKTGKPGGGRRMQTQRRAQRGSRREALLTILREGNGLSRGEILERMGLKGDRAGETSVSNALNALLKRNQLRREGHKYHLVSPEVSEAQLPLDATDGEQFPEVSDETSPG